MEIDSQQMNELLRIQNQPTAQSTRQQTSGASGQFGSLFSEALNSQSGASQASLEAMPPLQAGQAAMISQMLLNPIEQTEPLTTQTDPVQSAFDSASGTLDLWDSYTSTLRSSQDGSNLRNAYSILENIGAQVAELKASAAQLSTQNPGLNSLINELDIMTTTERVKFNRGDYA